MCCSFGVHTPFFWLEVGVARPLKKLSTASNKSHQEENDANQTRNGWLYVPYLSPKIDVADND